MAAKKKTTTSAAPVQGALAFADSCIGHDDLKSGVGKTAEDDTLYALGWPNMIWLEEGDATPKQLAARFYVSYPFEVGPTLAGVAPRMLRGLYALRNTPKKESEAIKDDSPISNEELPKLVEFIVTEQYGWVSTFLLEALFSPKVILDLLVPHIEAQKVEAWKKGPFESRGSGCVEAMHYLMLRTDREHAKTIRDRLEVVFEKVFKEASGYRPADSLDVALHGRIGVDRSGYRNEGILQNDVAYARDDVEWVRERAMEFVPALKSKDRGTLNARVAFLGGDAILEAAVANVKGIHADAKDYVAMGFSRMKHPAVRDLMKGLGSRLAKQWLKANG